MSIGLWGVVKDGLRNWIGGFIAGVEGNRNVCEAGSRNAGSGGFDGDWSSLYGPDGSDQHVALTFNATPVGLTLMTCETIVLLLAGGRNFHERGVRVCWTMTLLPLKVHWTLICSYVDI